MLNILIMKLKSLLYSIALLILFNACQKDENTTPEIKQGSYIKSYELVKTYTKKQAQSILAFAAIEEPGFLSLSNKVTSGVNIYSIKYEAPFDNKSILLSGLVIAPTSHPNNETMLMSFQNGTIVEHLNAPSKNLNNPQFLLLQAAAGLGMTICIPDYIGFGSSSTYQHPYLCKTPFTNSITSMIKAVVEMDEFEVLPVYLNGDIYLSGYSLGGWASLVTHKAIEDTPIENMKLIGSSCGAGSYDLIAMKDYLFDATDFIQPFYVPYLVTGLQSINEIEDDLSIFFNSPYYQIIPELFDGVKTTGEINEQLTPNMQLLLTSNMRDSFDTHSDFMLLKQALTKNSQQAWKNEKPIHLYHGTEDIHIPYTISEDIYNDFVDLGQPADKIKMTPLEEKDHTSGVIPMYIYVLNELVEIIQ